MNEERRAVQRQRARRRQDVVDWCEGIAAVFGILRNRSVADSREVECQASLEDARTADIGISGAEREGAETSLGQAAVRGVGGEGRRGDEGRTVTAGDNDRRGRGVTRAWVGDGHRRDLTRGFVEEGHGRCARATATDEANERSTEVTRARAREGDRTNARTRGACEDGLDANGEAIGVDRHTTRVNGRGADTVIDEVRLSRSRAEGAVVDVNQGDAVRAGGVNLEELG